MWYNLLRVEFGPSWTKYFLKWKLPIDGVSLGMYVEESNYITCKTKLVFSKPVIQQFLSKGSEWVTLNKIPSVITLTLISLI
jgi:hypothetical protein